MLIQEICRKVRRWAKKTVLAVTAMDLSECFKMTLTGKTLFSQHNPSKEEKIKELIKELNLGFLFFYRMRDCWKKIDLCNELSHLKELRSRIYTLAPFFD